MVMAIQIKKEMMRSKTMLVSGTIPMVTGTETILTEVEQTCSLTTQPNGMTTMAMAMVTMVTGLLMMEHSGMILMVMGMVTIQQVECVYPNDNLIMEDSDGDGYSIKSDDASLDPTQWEDADERRIWRQSKRN